MNTLQILITLEGPALSPPSVDERRQLAVEVQGWARSCLKGTAATPSVSVTLPPSGVELVDSQALEDLRHLVARWEDQQRKLRAAA